MKPSSTKRSRHLLVAAMVAIGMQTAVVVPTASADGPETALACAVPSGLFAEWARKLAGSRGGLFATVLGGAAVTYGCNKVFNDLDSGQSGQFDLRTPDGSVISQRLAPRDFPMRPPTYPRLAPRSVQCSGWTVPRFYNACMNYQLDPL
jgi:hypothetical protein